MTAEGLPAVGRLLAVYAHPDDESFGLGAVLGAYARRGTATFGLCFTHGEASMLHGVPGDLGAVRTRELEAAARVLGMSGVHLLDHRDGRLSEVALDELSAAVTERVATTGADALLVFDDGGITGHPDHQRATDAALHAAASLRLGVLAWTVPRSVAAVLNAEFGTCFAGRDAESIDALVRVDRACQRRAIACHASQSTDNPVLWRRLELLGDVESLRWLRDPEGARRPRQTSPAAP